MAEAIAFYFFAACILGFGVLVISSQNPVHSVIFLVLDFLSIAGLYIVLGAQFVAAIQVLVYAGGIVVLYLFVVMLVNVKRTPEGFIARERQSSIGLALAAAVLLELVAIAVLSRVSPVSLPARPGETIPVTGNTEQVGWLLYTGYLVPFEVASMLLLIAMIGAIVLARKET
jgi:NADH-quinone oxidoreductase subunit J